MNKRTIVYLAAGVLLLLVWPKDSVLGGIVFGDDSVQAAKPPSVPALAFPGITFEVLAPPTSSVVDLLSIAGPGTFVSALVDFSGSDVNQIEDADVSIILDGNFIFNFDLAGLLDLGLTEANPYGVMITESGNTMSIGFPVPLAFHNDLILRVSFNSGFSQITEVQAVIFHGA